ncbi:MAG: M3 family metallopeptidase [Proteobacteria bacterium]|nr:M3 family metallopeptidase [Pseudomonadota bacterium]
MSERTADNPLLAYGRLPAFDEIRAEHVVPAVRALLEELVAEVERIERVAEASWEGLVEPLERIGDRLEFTWGIARHLLGVRNGDELREAHETVQADVVGFGLRVGQSRPIYDALHALREGDDFDRLDAAQQRIVDTLLRDARHSGVGLDGADRDRFNAIAAELAELSTSFANHVLDATKAFALTLHEPTDIEGLPQSLLELAAQSARQAGEEGADAERGPWRITLDYPSFLPFMQHSRRRALREQVYRAYITRASGGELDNAPIIERILALRREQASLLGFDTYASLSLDTKMAPDVGSVKALLEELRLASWDAAHRDLEELRAFARERGAPEADDLAQWDVSFWSERVREERFDYSEEDLRPYFPFSCVLEGLFALADRLFGVRIEPADGETSIWHEDVRFFRVRNLDGEEVAGFFLDPYSRPEEKRGGAWMDECVGRSRLLAPEGAPVRLPVAYLVCNQVPPVDGRPSCMSFDEISTLFHEFGHGLQHMLTTVDYGLASGIRNVEWDAVELPSQFMENWCYEPDVLRGLSAHVETGEPIPDDFIEKIRAARTFRAGSDCLRQLYFALTDLELHHGEPAEGASAFDVQRRVASRTTVIPPLPEDRFLCSFGHIFGGGYAAGYYSYKWAEILSADAFAVFEEVDLADAEAVAATGRRYRDTILALGGSRPPMDVFVAFRGREPNTEALLRHSGLEAA